MYVALSSRNIDQSSLFLTTTQKNRLQESRHLFMTILECQRKARGELHADVGAALHNVGLVHLRLNKHAQALEYFERAVRVRKGSLGREHPEVAVSQVKVGISLLLMHEFDLALKAFLEALSIRKRALGALHPSLSRIYNNIACVHVEFNELREARRAFEAALDIQRNALCHEPDSGPLMFATATTLCNLGYLYRFRDMHQKAALVLNEALRVSSAHWCLWPLSLETFSHSLLTIATGMCPWSNSSNSSHDYGQPSRCTIIKRWVLTGVGVLW